MPLDDEGESYILPIDDQHGIEIVDPDEDDGGKEEPEDTVEVTTLVCKDPMMWYDVMIGECINYKDCDEMESGTAYYWRLNKETNMCEKVKEGMKFQTGLALLMICGMVSAVLFLVLDDKYFCLKPRDGMGEED